MNVDYITTMLSIIDWRIIELRNILKKHGDKTSTKIISKEMKAIREITEEIENEAQNDDN